MWAWRRDGWNLAKPWLTGLGREVAWFLSVFSKSVTVPALVTALPVIRLIDTDTPNCQLQNVRNRSRNRACDGLAKYRRSQTNIRPSGWREGGGPEMDRASLARYFTVPPHRVWGLMKSSPLISSHYPLCADATTPHITLYLSSQCMQTLELMVPVRSGLITEWWIPDFLTRTLRFRFICSAISAENALVWI